MSNDRKKCANSSSSGCNHLNKRFEQDNGNEKNENMVVALL